MAAVRWMAAVTMMAGLLAALLTGPVAAPNPRPGRPRRGFYPWRVLSGWLGCRRRARRESPARRNDGIAGNVSALRAKKL